MANERRSALGLGLLALSGLVSIVLAWRIPAWDNAIGLVWDVAGVIVIAFAAVFFFVIAFRSGGDVS